MLFLLFYGRFPSEKAASLFAAKSCEAFAEEGLRVVLLVPRRFLREKANPFEYYHTKQNFKVVFLPTVDFLFLPLFQKFFFFLGYFFFSVSSSLYLLFTAKKNDIIYSNESLPLFFATFFFKNTFYEMHDFPESKLALFGIFLKRVRFALVHNKWKISHLNEVFKVNPDKILHEPNAVDIHDFDIEITKEEARNKLNLPLDKKIAVYTGHLYGWKGVGTLAQSAKLLPPEYLVVFVGGTETDVVAFRKKYGDDSRVLIVGNKKHQEIPIWQKASDLLVLPNTAKEKISKYYTSPMKLFEYMASKRPVVATEIPSILEIVDKTTAVMVPPDDSASLAKGIMSAVGDKEHSEKISEKAYREVLRHTWQERAKRILSFINQ
jgi:glycosyltransferase involved in cell wall biosynthesis